MKIKKDIHRILGSELFHVIVKMSEVTKSVRAADVVDKVPAEAGAAVVDNAPDVRWTVVAKPPVKASSKVKGVFSFIKGYTNPNDPPYVLVYEEGGLVVVVLVFETLEVKGVRPPLAALANSPDMEFEWEEGGKSIVTFQCGPPQKKRAPEGQPFLPRGGETSFCYALSEAQLVEATNRTMAQADQIEKHFSEKRRKPLPPPRPKFGGDNDREFPALTEKPPPPQGSPPPPRRPMCDGNEGQESPALTGNKPPPSSLPPPPANLVQYSGDGGANPDLPTLGLPVFDHRLRDHLAETKADLATTNAELAASKAELATAKSELAATKSELAETKAELATAKEELAESGIDFDRCIAFLRDHFSGDMKKKAVVEGAVQLLQEEFELF